MKLALNNLLCMALPSNVSFTRKVAARPQSSVKRQHRENSDPKLLAAFAEAEQVIKCQLHTPAATKASPAADKSGRHALAQLQPQQMRSSKTGSSSRVGSENLAGRCHPATNVAAIGVERPPAIAPQAGLPKLSNVNIPTQCEQLPVLGHDKAPPTDLLQIMLIGCLD